MLLSLLLRPSKSGLRLLLRWRRRLRLRQVGLLLRRLLCELLLMLQLMLLLRTRPRFIFCRRLALLLGTLRVLPLMHPGCGKDLLLLSLRLLLLLLRLRSLKLLLLR